MLHAAPEVGLAQHVLEPVVVVRVVACRQGVEAASGVGARGQPEDVRHQVESVDVGETKYVVGVGDVPSWRTDARHKASVGGGGRLVGAACRHVHSGIPVVEASVGSQVGRFVGVADGLVDHIGGVSTRGVGRGLQILLGPAVAFGGVANKDGGVFVPVVVLHHTAAEVHEEVADAVATGSCRHQPVLVGPAVQLVPLVGGDVKLVACVVGHDLGGIEIQGVEKLVDGIDLEQQGGDAVVVELAVVAVVGAGSGGVVGAGGKNDDGLAVKRHRRSLVAGEEPGGVFHVGRAHGERVVLAAFQHHVQADELGVHHPFAQGEAVRVGGLAAEGHPEGVAHAAVAGRVGLAAGETEAVGEVVLRPRHRRPQKEYEKQ